MIYSFLSRSVDLFLKSEEASEHIVLSYKEYPHIDVNDRAVELFDLCVKAAEKTLKPAMAVVDCRRYGIDLGDLGPPHGRSQARRPSDC